MKPELSEIFEQLSKRLQDFGDTQTVSVEGEDFRIYQLSELSLQLELQSGREVPSGISFEVFDDEMFLTPDGSISVTDETQDEVSVYSLTDQNTIKAIYVFLKWRLTAIVNLKI